MNVEELNRRLVEAFSDECVKALAADGNPALSSIERVENWVGAYLVVHTPSGYVELERARDYERVKIPGEWLKADMWPQIVARIEKAIRKMGKRIERCLTQGTQEAKAFGGGSGQGMDGIGRWDGAPVTLYSCGAAPHLSDISDQRPAVLCDDDSVEVRIVYYANVGPSEARIENPEER